ncbi:DUF4381 domain-containing protein [Magnetospira thiophila]
MILHRMQDIRGLDPVSVWPLALGWWLLLGGGVLAVVFVLYARRRYRHWLRLLQEKWRADALRQLTALEKRIKRDDPKQLAVALSELLRRIAIARCGREACAGLQGEAWLAWLRDHDPQNFPWGNYRTLLVDLPYAPPGKVTEGHLIGDLRAVVAATRAWIASPVFGSADCGGRDGV